MLPASAVSGDKHRFCPYDPSHVILAKSFDAHLIKCRENHRGHKMVVCPLDHTHVVPKPELNHHLSQCDKRSLMDRDLQKRAGDNVLKGDIVGPPIVADHLADTADDGTENWDDAPVRSGPTPALFNEKLRNLPESYGIIPGGGYMPPSAEEPKIRKIPNNPAKAATLSNPAAAQIRPTRNQIFEFSIGKTRMARPDGNPARPSSGSLQAVAPGAPGGMSRARAPFPDQGPRFIGRGVSKYATKNNQKPAIPTSNSHLPTAVFTQGQENAFNASTPPNQYEDAAFNESNRAAVGRKDGVDAQIPLQQQQLGSFNAAATSLKNQQLLLQQGILLHQKQQLEQLKQQHNHQQMELVKKHQLQMLQLQKLQDEEKKRLAQQQEKQELELCAKTQALSQSLQEINSSSLSSSSVTPTQAIAAQNNFATDVLEAIMADGGNALSCLLSSMSVQNSSSAVEVPSDLSGGLKQARTQESWHEGDSVSNTPKEAISRLSPQDSKDSGNIDSNRKAELSPAELQKTKAKLQGILREIEILEQKSMIGHMLTKEEEAKLESKDTMEKQLEALLSSEPEKV